MITKKHLNSTKLHLPLFLATRNRIKKYHFSPFRTYITKNTKNYLVPCFEDTDEEDEDIGKIKQSSIKTEKSKEAPSKIAKNRRSEISWQLAPNRYNIPNELGCRKKGIQWSCSKKSAPYKKDVRLQNTQSKFYEMSVNFFEKSKNKCNSHKGKFSSDPRNRRPTTRFMINNPVTCWRNPNDPGPSTYFLGIFQGTSFPKHVKKHHVVPYKFLRNSSVPENLRFRISGNSSFSPGPGRYELLDDEQSLRISLRIQTQKRLQFRRLHFKQKGFPKQNPGSTNRHIFGYGFTRLFRGSISTIKSKKFISSKRSHRTGHEIRMFPSFDYIKMITHPDRNTLSMRLEELIESSDIILRFNCLVRALKRRQLRDNKKVVFGSGVPRFKDSDMPIIRNQSKPPALGNFPIMRVNPKEIKTKLNDLPDRLRGIYKSNRIQPFKFQPIPPVKLLLDEKEVHPESEEGFEIFTKELNPMDFLKNEFKKNIN